MRSRVWLAAAAASVLVTSGSAAPASGPAYTEGAGRPIYLDRSYTPEERAVDLVSRMTLAEKAAQLISSQSAPLPDLGLEAYGWWNEAAHGVAREGTLHNANPPILINTTSYPVDLSLASTWNPDLAYREAALISDEAREVVRDNRLDLNFYSPTINLARDPRWGRNDEAFSEDPLLTAAIAAQFVNGMEGKDRGGRLLPAGGGYLKTSTTLKHYAANNSEFDRRRGTSNMDDRTLREYYTAQFREVIRRSSPASIMTSYNRVNGEPTSASTYLMDELARQTFGFAGFFTSDCDSIREIEDGHHWQPPGRPAPLDHIERHAWASAAGEDLNCQQGYHDEYNYANTLPSAVALGTETPQGRYTEDFIDASLVRLLATRIRLGELDGDVPWVTAARARVPRGTWTNSDANRAVTQTRQRLAMAREVAGESIVLLKNRRGALPLRVPAAGPYRVAVIGHYANPASMYLGGYSSIQQSAGQANEVNGYQGIKAAIQERNPAAVVDHLPGVTPESLATVDPASVAAAAGYDAVIVYAGTDERHSREDVDRTTLKLPGAQEELITQVAAQNPNTIVYLETAGQVDVGAFERQVAAILWSSYNGQRKGEALADVLLGARNPSGHLPFTWYRDASQLPPIDDYNIRTGRTYMYFGGEASYPFGFGGSYTTFRYSRLAVDRHQVDANGTVRATVDVTNTGRVEGAEVVQLYVASPAGFPERPGKRLRAFEKVSLRPGQIKRVAFEVRVPDLAFFDERLDRYTVDRGRYAIEVGSSSARAEQRTHVTVTGELRPRLSVVTAKAPVRVARGAVVTPALTVALTDDRLFSGALPPGTTVTWKSNRPSVIRAEPRGTLRAVGAGVATVTATVTYAGTSRSTTLAVGVR